MKPKIGITIGDYNGIGPEIALKALLEIDLVESTPILIAPPSILNFYKQILSSNLSLIEIQNTSQVTEAGPYILNLNNSSPQPVPESLTKESGTVAMQSIEDAIDLCLNDELHAMVTLPISKEAINLAGYKIPGHTEFLAKKTNTNSVLMILVSGDLRVALTTVHIPISQVATSITTELIIEKATILDRSLKRDFSISHPKIAVLGLNPHAGDGGVIGTEEIEIIQPALQTLKEQGIKAEGAFPADGFFGQKRHLQYDAILAMYHDQGLAPFKSISFGQGVNFTAGLPIIRTSPDHGTAFDIAGKGVADPSSFLQAYKLAVELVHLNNR